MPALHQFRHASTHQPLNATQKIELSLLFKQEKRGVVQPYAPAVYIPLYMKNGNDRNQVAVTFATYVP